MEPDMENAGDPLGTMLGEIRKRPRCQLLPPRGPAISPTGFNVPADIGRFYELCGGGLLFEGSNFPWRLYGPTELVASGVRLLGSEPAAQIAAQYPDDLTNTCFTFAEGGPGGVEPVIVVDLHPARSGRFYLAAWETFGVAGSMPVVATSVAEVLHVLLETRGKDLESLTFRHGDAYDGFDS